MFLSSPRVDSIFSNVCTFSWRAFTSLRSEGLASPSVRDFSAPTNQGVNSLIPVLYSAQNLTSSEKASQSFLTFSARSSMYLVMSKLILEVLGILGDIRALGKKIQFSVCILFQNLHLCSNVLLKIHCPGHSVFWQH